MVLKFFGTLKFLSGIDRLKSICGGFKRIKADSILPLFFIGLPLDRTHSVKSPLRTVQKFILGASFSRITDSEALAVWGTSRDFLRFRFSGALYLRFTFSGYLGLYFGFLDASTRPLVHMANPPVEVVVPQEIDFDAKLDGDIYSYLPNGGREIQCNVCLRNLNTSIAFRTVGELTKHLNDKHARWTEWGDVPGFPLCPKGCNRRFCGVSGLRAHIGQVHKAEGVQPPVAVGEAVALVVPPAAYAEFQHVDDNTFLAPFMGGLYFIHREWAPLLWDIVVSLLEAMTADAANCHSVTLAFMALPGMMSFTSAHKATGRVVDLLRRIAARPSAVDKAAQVRSEGIFLLYQRSKGEYAKRPRQSGVKGAVRTAEHLCRAGRLSAAARILDSVAPMLDRANPQEHPQVPDAMPQAPVLSDAERKQLLAELHPKKRSDEWDKLTAADGTEINMASEPLGIILDCGTVLEGIKMLKVDAAPGASGWTNTAIKSLSRHCGGAAEQERLGTAVCGVFNAISDGSMPMSVQGLWTRTRSVLLPKAGGGYRPLGIRDCWYRLMARMLVKDVAASGALDVLPPLQLCAGVPGGCEIGARISQLMYDRKDEGGNRMALIRFDIKNCFNLLANAIALLQMRGIAPQLVRAFIWLYCQPNDLIGPDGSVVGQREVGAAQGCPLSMLIAALALIPVGTELTRIMKEEEAKHWTSVGIMENIAPEELDRRREAAAGAVSQFADDGTMGALLSVLANAFPRIAVEAYAPHGLTLVNTKSVVCCKSGLDGFSDGAFGDMQLATEGIVALGNPVGTPEFRRQYVEKKLDKFKPDIRSLSLLSKRFAFQLINFVYNARPEFLKRVVDPMIAPEAFNDYDQVIGDCTLKLLGCGPNEVGFFQELRGVKAKLGGLGLRRHFGITAEQGGILSRFLTASMVDRSIPSLVATMQEEWSEGIQWGRLEGLVVKEEYKAKMESKVLETVKEGIKLAYADFARDVTLSVLTKLDSEGDVGKSKRAWMLSGSVSKRSILPFWLSLEGNWGGVSYFPNADFVSMLRMMFFAPILNPAGCAIKRCAGCEAVSAANNPGAEPEPVDITQWYTHPMGCKAAGDFTVRHNAVRDLLYALFKKHLPREAEVLKEAVVQEASEENGTVKIQMDIVVRLEGTAHLIDIAIVDPGCPTYVAKGSNVRSLCAADNREADKIAEFNARMQDLENGDNSFVPFVIESSGRLGNRASGFLMDIMEGRLVAAQFRKAVPLLLARHSGRSLTKLRNGALRVVAGGQEHAAEAAQGGNFVVQEHAAAAAPVGNLVVQEHAAAAAPVGNLVVQGRQGRRVAARVLRAAPRLAVDGGQERAGEDAPGSVAVVA